MASKKSQPKPPSKKTPSSGTGTDTGSDPIKDRFKAALEKKQNASHGSGSQSKGGEKAIGPNATNNKTQQMFRRKSGGS